MSLIGWLRMVARTSRKTVRQMNRPLRSRWMCYRPWIESLENRLAPAVTSSFSGGLLTLTYDGTSNTDALTIMSVASGPMSGNTFQVIPSPTTQLDDDIGPEFFGDVYSPVEAIRVVGNLAADALAVTFDTNSVTMMLSGSITVTDIETVTITDNSALKVGTLEAYSFAESGGILAATTFGSPLTTAGAPGISATGDDLIAVNNTLTSMASSTDPVTLAATARATSTLTMTAAGTITSAGAVNLTSNTSLDLAGPVNAGNNPVILIASTTITQTAAGAITGGLLMTSSGGGTQLTATPNAVINFNASDGSSTGIALSDVASPLIITGISETGTGSVAVNNTGGITASGTITSASGAISLMAEGGTSDLVINAAVQSVSGRINVTATNFIGEAFGGLFSTTGPLDTGSGAGTILRGPNAVSSFNAGDDSAAGINLINTASPLTVTGIIEDGGSITINNTGGITTTGPVTTDGGAVSMTASGNLLINGAISAGHAVNLQGNGVLAINGNLTSASEPVTVQGGPGNDGITINAVINGSLDVVSGAQPDKVLGGAGNDTITVNAVGRGFFLDLDGQAGSNVYIINELATGDQDIGIDNTGKVKGDVDSATFNETTTDLTLEVSPNAVAGSFASISPYLGLDNLTINAGTGNDSISVTGTQGGTAVPITPLGTLTTINGGNGNDTYTIASPAQLLNLIQATLTINAGTGANVLTADDSADGSDFVVVTSDTIYSNLGEFSLIRYNGSFQSVTLSTGSGNDTVNVQGTSSLVQDVVVNAGQAFSLVSTDFILISSNVTGTGTLAGISGTVYINAGGNGARLEVSDQGNPGATAYTILTQSSIERSDGGAPIIYTTTGAFNQVLLAMGQGNDSINVRSTSAEADNTVVDTGAGNSTITVSSTPAATGSIQFIKGALTFNSGSGTNTLQVSDEANPGSTAYNVLTNASIEGPGVPRIIYGTSGTFAQVLLLMGQGNDSINVRSTLAAANTVVETGAGNDTFTVSTTPDATGTLQFLQGALTLLGGGGSNTLQVSDQANPGRTAYDVLTNASIEGPGVPPIIYGSSGSLANVFFSMGQGNDSINVRSTLAAAAMTTVKTGAGNNNITVSTSPDGSGGVLDFLRGDLTINGASGQNHLVVGEASSAAADTVNFTNDSISSSGGVFAPITYVGNFSGSSPRESSIGTEVSADVVLLLGQADNLNFENKSPTESIYIRMGVGSATNAANVEVFSTSAYTGLTIDLADSNVLNVNDLSGGGQSFIVPGSVPGTGKYLVEYSGSTSEIDFIGRVFQSLF